MLHYKKLLLMTFGTTLVVGNGLRTLTNCKQFHVNPDLQYINRIHN